MAGPGFTGNHIAPGVVQDAIVQIMQSALGRGQSVDMDMARDMAVRLAPAVQSMGLAGLSSSVLSGNAAFHALITQHLGSPAAASYDPAFRRQLQQVIENANIHGPDYLGGVVDGIRLARAALERTSGGPPDARERPPNYRDLPGATIPGNADMSGVTLANYFTSPITRSLVGMGMNYGTFDYMRGQGFNRTHIQHAGEDARRHGYNPNNREVVRDFGIVNREDGARRAERNELLERYRARLRSDAEIRRLRAERERATTDEERRRIDAQARERDAVIRREMGVDRFVEQTPQAAREADQRIFNREFSGAMAVQRGLDQQAGPEVAHRTIITPPPPAQPPPITDRDRTTATADVAQTQLQMDAELAALRGPQQPAAAPPPATGERRVVVQLPPNTPQGPT